MGCASGCLAPGCSSSAAAAIRLLGCRSPDAIKLFTMSSVGETAHDDVTRAMAQKPEQCEGDRGRGNALRASAGGLLLADVEPCPSRSSLPSDVSDSSRDLRNKPATSNQHIGTFGKIARLHILGNHRPALPTNPPAGLGSLASPRPPAASRKLASLRVVARFRCQTPGRTPKRHVPESQAACPI